MCNAKPCGGGIEFLRLFGRSKWINKQEIEKESYKQIEKGREKRRGGGLPAHV